MSQMKTSFLIVGWKLWTYHLYFNFKLSQKNDKKTQSMDFMFVKINGKRKNCKRWNNYFVKQQTQKIRILKGVQKFIQKKIII